MGRQILDLSRAGLAEYRRRYEAGAEVVALAAEYGVARNTMAAALRRSGASMRRAGGDAWAHVNDKRRALKAAVAAAVAAGDHLCMSPSVVHNAVGQPVRLLCACGNEWRVVPVDALVTLNPVEPVAIQGAES